MRPFIKIRRRSDRETVGENCGFRISAEEWAGGSLGNQVVTVNSKPRIVVNT
jgi:hypothetical protein